MTWLRVGFGLLCRAWGGRTVGAWDVLSAPPRAVREGSWSALRRSLVLTLFVDSWFSCCFRWPRRAPPVFMLAVLPNRDTRRHLVACPRGRPPLVVLPCPSYHTVTSSVRYACARSAHSTELNGSRLKVLKARDEVLREVYDDADKRLARISTENPDVYKALLSSLILQSLLALRDEEVVVRTREADAAAVESALKTVSEEYTDKTDGAAINTVVDSKRFLSENWYVPVCPSGRVLPLSMLSCLCGAVGMRGYGLTSIMGVLFLFDAHRFAMSMARRSSPASLPPALFLTGTGFSLLMACHWY